MADPQTHDAAPTPERPADTRSATVTATPRGMHPLRKRALLGVTAVVLLAALAWALYDWLVLRHEEYTDNAYVQGDVVQITPQQGGTVTAIHADATDRVQAGQALVELDGADARVALAQAEAALGQAVRQARKLYVDNAALQAQVRLREADVARARTQLASARQDLRRRQGLEPGGAVSAEELAHARAQATSAQSGFDAASAALRAARAQLAGNQALTAGTPVAEHPSVLAAAARVREAWLALHRTVLPAPVAGYVSQRVVQLGQRVAPGAPLMSVVPLDALWVDANFKESQLGAIRIGQPVRLTADLYGGRVVYDGRVVGLGVATGAASALLPAQNATGNWIKVVQRVPVRIALDPAQLRAHPLRLGLSMEATVDISDQGGPMLAEAPQVEPLGRTPVFADAGQGAEARVHEIIARNLGQRQEPES